MSADNRICIMQDEDERWYVWMGSLSCEYYAPPSSSKPFITKEDAMQYAISCAEECVVLEGGIEEISVQEQSQALAWEIEDLAMRMRSLLDRGCQWERNFN